MEQELEAVRAGSMCTVPDGDGDGFSGLQHAPLTPAEIENRRLQLPVGIQGEHRNSLFDMPAAFVYEESTRILQTFLLLLASAQATSGSAADVTDVKEAADDLAVEGRVGQSADSRLQTGHGSHAAHVESLILLVLALHPPRLAVVESPSPQLKLVHALHYPQ
eukprot:765020-Hanusia_phi.AAC.3